MSDPLNYRLLCPDCAKKASAEKITFIRILAAFNLIAAVGRICRSYQAAIRSCGDHCKLKLTK